MFAFRLTSLLCIAVFGLTFIQAGQYDGKVLRVIPQTDEDIENLRSLGTDYGLEIDFWQAPSQVSRNVDIYVHQKDLSALLEVLQTLTLSYSVLIEDVQTAVEKENPPESRAGGFQYDRYNKLPQIYAEMRRLASAYPNIASIFSTGKSYEGNEQLAVKSGRKPEYPEKTPRSTRREPTKLYLHELKDHENILAKISSKTGGKKKMYFFNCGIHAREWITPATCMYMINEMLSKYGRDSSVTSMVDKMDWVIMPSVNPDGYIYTHSGSRMWRRTRTRHSGCIGADPNRNWNYKWGGVGTSSRCSDTYHGPRPFSEVETYNVAKYLLKNRRDLIGYMDIHAYSQLWMTPWGYKKAYPDDNGEQMRVGKIAAAALRNAGYGTQYKVGPSSVIIYSTTGSTGDWASGVLGVKYSYALELRDKGTYGFLLPANQIIPTGRETFAAMKAMANAMKMS